MRCSRASTRARSSEFSTSSAERSSAVTAVSAPTEGLSNMPLSSHARDLNIQEYAYFYSTFRISSDSLELQLTMSLCPHIKAIEQLIEFPAAHRHRVPVCNPRPDKTLLLKPLRPQHQAIAFPVQNPDPVAPRIAEHIQRRCK